jgi:hypothetical protein
MRRRNAVLVSAIVALAIGASLAPAAGANPSWRFGGKLLEGTETVVGNSTNSSLTIPGLTTSCKNLHYKMNIWNFGSTGRGEITETLFEECSTNSPSCPIESITAEKLPWPLRLVTVTSDYVIVEAIKATIFYAGEECPLSGIAVVVTGQAGGLFENLTSTISFTPATFKTTKTELKALGSKVEWNGLFSTEATGLHAGEKLEG